MAKKSSKKENLDKKDNIVGVDQELSLYDLTDLFYSYFRYHNDDCLFDFSAIRGIENGKVKEEVGTLSRFEAFRRIESARLGSRPYMGGVGVAKYKPNINNGYLSLLFSYLVLPYQSVLNNGEVVKISVNRKLYNVTKLSEKEIQVEKLESKNNPNLSSNKEIGEDTSNAFNDVLRVTRSVNKVHEELPLSIIQNAFGAVIHSDIDRSVEIVSPLDLITEPQCNWDPTSWSNFFVIRRMRAHEVIQKIESPGQFWNRDALRWALENSAENRGSITANHYRGTSVLQGSPTNVNSENFCVKSFYNDKKNRMSNVHGYYGNLLVVEGYYINTKGKITKVIFFPSLTFQGISSEERDLRAKMSNQELIDAKLDGIDKADVLFKREIAKFDNLKSLITVIPANRAEPSLERQRFYGHELFNPTETVMRLDSNILNAVNIMSVIYTRNRNQGNNSQNVEDLQIEFTGETCELGDREIVETPFQADLNAMTGARTLYLQHALSKAFLGGLDGEETLSSGRGASLANLRLVRDGRVHKHNIEFFATGLKEMYSKIYISILDTIKNETLLEDDVAVKRLFLDTLTELYGYEKTFFTADEKDIIPDTGLPYWMDLEVIRNGASHFGAAEIVLYSEIKKIFGDGLPKAALDALNRMGIKSLLGSQDSLDILGDPQDLIVTEQDQIYRATLENAAILGSTDLGVVSFESVGILADKDDPIAHLSNVHNPKANEILQKLNEADTTNDNVADMSEQELESRSSLILKLAALANHISLHQQQLTLYGKDRDDVNKLREETNQILQSSEGLLNNLQSNLRALQSARQEQQARMQNLSPENEAAKMKAEKDLADLQVKQQQGQAKLLLANKIADQKQQQHIDKQLTKARDRALKEKIANNEFVIKEQELSQQRFTNGKDTSSKQLVQ